MKPNPPYAQEIQLIKQYVNKDSICLDIGANIGSFTVFLSGIAKHVYAFEPEPNNFKQLQENTKHLDNVEIFDIALSHKLGYETLYTCPTNTGMHRMYKSKWCEGGEQIKVPVSTIDITFILNHFTPTINFVKIDVEGFEYNVIMGMMNIIKRDHPTIMMEWHPPSLIEAGTNPEDLYSFMIHRLGYNQPRHMLLHGITIKSYEELNNYTVDIPAINILWQHPNQTKPK